MSSTFFHRFGKEKHSEKKQHQGVTIFFTYDLGFENTKERKQGKGEQRGNRDGHRFEDPPKCSP